MKTLLRFALTFTLLLPLGFVHSASAAATLPDPSDDAAYAAGTHALNEQRWPDAVREFDTVIAAKGNKRVDAALYWKAYALNKMARQTDAEASCAVLRAKFPASSWNSDCGALSAGVTEGGSQASVATTGKSAAGPDDDLKILALNSLIHQDPARAMPVLRDILASDKSPEMKKHALFVLTQSKSPEAAATVHDAVMGKMGPEVQIQAVHAVGIFQGQRANEMLAELYRSTSDLELKKAVISAFFISNDAPRLVELARNEKIPEMKRAIVSKLALMNDKAATDYMLELLK